MKMRTNPAFCAKTWTISLNQSISNDQSELFLSMACYNLAVFKLKDYVITIAIL